MAKSFIKDSVRTLTDVTIGGAAIQAVGNSQMTPGLKQATQIGISAGIAGRSIGRNKKWL